MFIQNIVCSIILSFIILVPLGIKWELEKKVVIPTALLIGIISWIVVRVSSFFVNLKLTQVFVFQVAIIIVMAISLMLWRFFRDPERIPPDIENAILSPADGRIIYVKTIQNGEIPFSEKDGRILPLTDFVRSDVLHSNGYLIGIAMNYLDVHVNRAPIEGRLCLLKHIKGLFISLKKREAIIQNERVLTVIENGYLRVGVVQIASRIVRKIIPYIKEGQEIKRGQRIGVIRFGSQVDVVLPDLLNLRIHSNPGDKVKAGLSVIATFRKNYSH